MKTYRNGTTDHQWEVYRADLEIHERYMESIKPVEEEFDDVRDYDNAMLKWHEKLVMDAPSKPGAYYSNNH